MGTTTSVDILTEQECRLLVQQIHEPRDKAIVMLFLSTGLFLNELISLTLASIDWETKTIRIEGKRPRSLPLDEPTFASLASWSQARIATTTDALFLTTKVMVSALSERSVDHLIRKYTHAANIERNTNAHILRNTYATRLFKSELDSEVISERLGITDWASLNRYKTDLTVDSPSPIDTRKFSEKLFTSKPNPGTVLQPPKDIDIPAEIIFGRDTLIKELRSSIYHNEPSILIGDAGIGKTHLLQHLQTHYPNSLYIPSVKPIKTFLITLATHLDPDWETHVSKRASAPQLLDWICHTSDLNFPILFLDDCHTLTQSDMGTLITLLDHKLPMVLASTKLLDKVPKLQWRLKTQQVEALSEKASQELIAYLTKGLSITDHAMLDTKMKSLGNGVPAAIVELARQLRYHPVITQDVIRKLYHNAGIRYRDWTPALVVIWSMMVCARFVALGTHSFEGYILAGIGTTFFVVFKFFMMKMSR